MRSLARRSSSHSSSAGGRLKRDGASVAPGSIRMPTPSTSTNVAIERTPMDSAASGMTFIALDTPAAVDLDTRPGDHRRVVGRQEDGGPCEILGLIEPAEWHGRLVPCQPFGVDGLLVHERG